MQDSRRGFLVGAAKLIGAGLTLAMVPQAMARKADALIWTPATDEPTHDTDGRRIVTVAPGAVLSNVYLQNCLVLVYGPGAMVTHCNFHSTEPMTGFHIDQGGATGPITLQ